MYSRNLLRECKLNVLTNKKKEKQTRDKYTKWGTCQLTQCKEIISQCMSNHHDIHLKYLIILYVSCTSISLKLKMGSYDWTSTIIVLTG